MLVECPDCGREVSDLAVTCPQCARPLRAETSDPEAAPVTCAECGTEYSSNMAITCPGCAWPHANSTVSTNEESACPPSESSEEAKKPDEVGFMCHKCAGVSGFQSARDSRLPHVQPGYVLLDERTFNKVATGSRWAISRLRCWHCTRKGTLRADFGFVFESGRSRNRMEAISRL